MIARTCLRDQIADVLRREIASGYRPGQKLDSVNQLARRFSVSNITVSQALLVLAKEELIESRPGSGTFVADRTGFQHVALVIGIHPDYPTLNYSATAFMEKLQLALNQAGWPVNIYLARFGNSDNADPTCDHLKRNLAQNRVGGVAVVRGPFNPRWEEMLSNCDVPVVGWRPGCVVENNRASMVREGVEYLLRAGCHRIAALAWRGRPVLPLPDDRVVRDAFREVLEENGLSVHDGWFRDDLPPMFAAAGYEEFREIWMAHSAKPDGLLILDDVLFSDVAIAIMELGIRVPEQLLVVTQANKGSGVRYPFPTVRMEYDLGEAARIEADMLVKLIGRQPASEPRVPLPFQWVGGEEIAEGIPSSPTRTQPVRSIRQAQGLCQGDNATGVKTKKEMVL